MDPGMFVLPLLLLALAAFGLYGYLQARKRLQDLRAWAVRKGLSFTEERDYSVEARFPEFPAFSKGDERYAYNRWNGRWGERPVEGFDYHYQTYSHSKRGRQTHHHRFSVVVVSSSVPLKPLFIRPEGFLDQVTEFFGHDDIDLESAEFSRRFYVKSPDRRWAFDVLHARAMEFLLARPPFHLQFSSGRLLAWRGNATLSFQEFEQALETARGLLDALPEYLVRQQKGAL